MTKMIKLSLVAAVAVAGLTTSATAGSLENAIKDTTISGKAMIGYNFKDNGITNTNSNQTEYDLDITMTTKVNDTISFTSGLQADHDVAIDADQNTDTNSKANGDKITLTKAYFTAKTDVATVMIGKQKQPTPFLDDERGDGVVAIIPAGPVTIAAGHFTGMNGKLEDVTANIFSKADISALAIIGSAGPVNGSLWYAKEAGIIDGTSLSLAANVGPVKIDFRHSTAELIDVANSEAETLTKVIVTGKAANVNLTAAYAMTNNVTTRSHGVDWEGIDAKTNFALDILNLDTVNDADAILLGASMKFGATTVGANYLMVDAGTNTDATELDVTVKYAMSKNFSITGLYSTAEVETANVKSTDEDRMELSLNYKF